MLNERAVRELQEKYQGIHVHGRVFIAGRNAAFIADVLSYAKRGQS